MTTLADRLLDLAIVPGYSRLGYALRQHAWAEPQASLEGQTVVVTGASSGIGEATAALLADRGALVRIVARDRTRGAAAQRRLEAVAPDRIVLDLCDLSDLDQAHELGLRLRSEAGQLAGVVHNAGVLVDERRRTPEGHEIIFATSVLGPLALSFALRPALAASDGAVVVFVSSGGMLTARLDADDPELDRREFDGPRFYAHAKRAQVALAEQLAERWPGVGFASMHPGWVDTPGLESSLPLFHRLTGPLLRTPEQGADTAAWLIGGTQAFEHPGAFWHDRHPRPKHLLARTREGEADRLRFWNWLIQRLGDHAVEAG